jgi:hypothetical protein
MCHAWPGPGTCDELQAAASRGSSCCLCCGCLALPSSRSLHPVIARQLQRCNAFAQLWPRLSARGRQRKESEATGSLKASSLDASLSLCVSSLSLSFSSPFRERLLERERFWNVHICLHVVCMGSQHLSLRWCLHWPACFQFYQPDAASLVLSNTQRRTG